MRKHLIRGVFLCAFLDRRSPGWQAIYSLGGGYNVIAKGDAAVAYGIDSQAYGNTSLAIGHGCRTGASDVSGTGSGAGWCAAAIGSSCVADGNSQVVLCGANVIDTSHSYALIVGNGTTTSRSNALAVDWNGNLRLRGRVYTNCNADSSGGRCVGEIKSARLGSGKAITAGTVANLCSISLTTGKWIITAVARFPNTSNTTYRVLALGTSATDTQPVVQTAAVNGYPTYLNATKIVEVTGASQTYYLNVLAGTSCTMPYGTVCV